MGNVKNKKIVRLYGITIAKNPYMTRPFGHGCEKVDGVFKEYVDYFIEDILVALEKANIDITKLVKSRQISLR